MTLYPHLFTPIAAGPFNRMIMGSMYTGLEAERDGIVADTIVVCAGQEPLRALDENVLAAVGIGCTYVGGAKISAELDAKRAIEAGVRIGLAL